MWEQLLNFSFSSQLELHYRFAEYSSEEEKDVKKQVQLKNHKYESKNYFTTF